MRWNLTNASIRKDKQERSIVEPLDFEPTADAFPFRECALNVFGFELRGKPSEGEDASDRGGKGWKRRSHGVGGGSPAWGCLVYLSSGRVVSRERVKCVSKVVMGRGVECCSAVLY